MKMHGTSQPLSVAADAKTPASWIQVAVVGEYQDPRYGQFSITPEMLSSMVLNFSSGRFPEPPTEICIDYDHLTTKEPTAPGDGKAAAWFKELKVDADGEELWARVEWTPEGAAAVRSGEYKFFSPYFSTDFENNKGEKLGPCLINGAITNRPFLQGMQPLSLSAGRGKSQHPLDAAARVLRLHNPTLSVEQATARALEHNPELYLIPYDAPIAQVAARAVDSHRALTTCGRVLQSLNRSLSKEQATTKALELTPALYVDNETALSENSIYITNELGEREVVTLLPAELVEFIERQAAALYPSLETALAVEAMFGKDRETKWQYHLYKHSAEYHRSQAEE